jgi:hypothetical protein
MSAEADEEDEPEAEMIPEEPVAEMDEAPEAEPETEEDPDKETMAEE